MGDGRYYTSDQFFSVILFTTLIVFVVISFMLSIYKVEEHKRMIRVLGITLFVSLISAFIYEIAYNRASIVFFKYINYIAFVAYFTNSVIFIIINRDGDSRKFILVIFLIVLFIPTMIIMKIGFERNVIYVLYTLHYVLLFKKFVKYKVSSSVFNDVKKSMLDYVFIISIRGKVIFKNDKVNNSDIFAKNCFVDINNIEGLFCHKITVRNAFSKQFIKVEDKNKLYFQYHKKEIQDKQKLVGYILTFVDVTQLISMLDRLSEKREQIKKANRELDEYKDIVYDIEKEKEINVLLDEIANNQQKSMYVLKKNLETLDIRDKNFLAGLEEISIKAKTNLKDVRTAVTSYIKHYQ